MVGIVYLVEGLLSPSTGLRVAPPPRCRGPSIYTPHDPAVSSDSAITYRLSKALKINYLIEVTGASY